MIVVVTATTVVVAKMMMVVVVVIVVINTTTVVVVKVMMVAKVAKVVMPSPVWHPAPSATPGGWSAWGARQTGCSDACARHDRGDAGNRSETVH